MAVQSSYKNSRQSRQALVETDFGLGMMFTNSTLQEGYVNTLVNFDYEEDNSALVPRAGLRTSEVIFPDSSIDVPSYDEEGLIIQDMKECVEDGKEYRQIVLRSKVVNGEANLWFLTSDKSSESVEITPDHRIGVSVSKLLDAPHKAKCFTHSQASIHNALVSADSDYANSTVGCFAFGNSYYFFGIDGTDVVLYKTMFDKVTGKYVPEKVEVKDTMVAEAVSYGYNMLAENPYLFTSSLLDGLGSIQLTGILPYNKTVTESETVYKLLMTPKKNEMVWFRLYYNAPLNQKYRLMWEWREVTASDWTPVEVQEVVFDSADKVIECGFQPPSDNIMIRVAAYRWLGAEYDSVVEKAMTVGFDFSVDEHGTISQIQQANYDLSTATGMVSWKNRLVLWGVPEDPTILFVSDLNEPGYFPYPNNISVLDEPIVHVVPFLDDLLVFTRDKIYQITLNEDGTSWIATVVQSNLYIEPNDKHLIKVVRNMVYFKSGNYYYMMVPKRESLAGEMTLAPITTPITSFFDNFMSNVERVLFNTFNRVEDTYDLVHYFNFLNYDEIHNMYVFSWTEGDTLKDSLIHFDVVYNTNSRSWKINVYEHSGILYNYRNDATQRGYLASTTLFDVDDKDASAMLKRRLVQILAFNKLDHKDFYIPSTAVFQYSSDYTSEIGGLILKIPPFASVTGDVLTLDSSMLSVPPVKDSILRLSDTLDYYEGFKISGLINVVSDFENSYDEYFTYRNYQYLDTGYKARDTYVNKRYREMQMQISNPKNSRLQFAMNFMIAGEPRNLCYKYEVSQVIDEFNDDSGIVYVDSIPYVELDPTKIDRSNLWTIENNLSETIDFWKVRTAISGKGAAPRLKLNSMNEESFSLISLGWIYRVMNMR